MESLLSAAGLSAAQDASAATGRRHACAVCGKAFLRPVDLCSHERTHTGEKPFKCSFAGCGKTFAHRSNQCAHERRHRDERKYNCRFTDPTTNRTCTHEYTHASSLKEHERAVHDLKNGVEFKCSEQGCEATFRHRKSLYRHLKTHPGITASTAKR